MPPKAVRVASTSGSAKSSVETSATCPATSPSGARRATSSAFRPAWRSATITRHPSSSSRAAMFSPSPPDAPPVTIATLPPSSRSMRLLTRCCRWPILSEKVSSHRLVELAVALLEPRDRIAEPDLLEVRRFAVRLVAVLVDVLLVEVEDARVLRVGVRLVEDVSRLGARRLDEPSDRCLDGCLLTGLRGPFRDYDKCHALSPSRWSVGSMLARADAVT